MTETVKQLIRAEVAYGNLTAILEACASECNHQAEIADTWNDVTNDQLIAITDEWERQEKFLDVCRHSIEQGHPF